MENIATFDSVKAFNDFYGIETKNPLVAVVELKGANISSLPSEMTYNYGVFALFLKQTYCGDITYGRMPYDYQEGTVTSFAPGQVINMKYRTNLQSSSLGLIFHPDLIKGTSLGKGIRHYAFFSYSSREALHVSEEEKAVFKDCLEKIRMETERPTDKHSKKLICGNIELLLDYCMRFYERQFDTRKNENRNILAKFEDELDHFFESKKNGIDGLPSVKYFAEKCFLSPNYFGDVIKKETGSTPQELIQDKVICIAKEELLTTHKTVSEISNRLGFLYSQHFNRYFKRNVGMTPNQFRQANS